MPSNTIIESLHTINVDEIQSILNDTTENKSILDHFLETLSLDKVLNINWLRILQDDIFQIVTQLSEIDLLNYFQAGLWIDDMVLIPHRTKSFKIIDYKDIKKKCQYIEKMADTLTLMFSQNYTNIYDVFTFDIDRHYFSNLNNENYALLHERLRITINALYKYIHFKQNIKIQNHVISSKFQPSSNEKIIRDKYKLTHLNLDYLRLIATGNTAKEIAIHLDRSYRSVQDTISHLCKKLNCADKEQLAYTADIIMSYIR